MGELISIIIPVYNAEHYLSRCLDSVINQTYHDLEIFLVDDGSTDNSSKIMEDYANADTRIRIIHKENGGLSDARNVALNRISGEFISFLDSDDWINPKYIESLYHNLKTNCADISIVDTLKVWDNSTVNTTISSHPQIREYTPVSAIADMWYQKQIGIQAWGKLYRTALFSDIRYPVGKLYEDLATTHLLFWGAHKIIYSSEPLYYYYQHSGSIMYRPFDRRNMDRIDAGAQLLFWAQSNCPSLIRAAQTRFFVSNIQVLREIPLQDKFASEIQTINRNIRQYRRAVLKNKEAKTSIRLIAFFSRIDYRLLKKLGSIYKLIYK